MISRTAVTYVGIGGAGALGYVLVSSLLVYLGLWLWLASMTGYLIMVPMVYLAQRKFAFQSNSSHHSAFPKYVGIQLFGIALAAVLPNAMLTYLQVPAPFGFAAVAVMIGVINFFILRFWAFPVTRGV